jgi:hypothetical protein
MAARPAGKLPLNGCKAVSGVARPQGIEGLGTKGLCDTLRSPWPRLPIRPWETDNGIMNKGSVGNLLWFLLPWSKICLFGGNMELVRQFQEHAQVSSHRLSNGKPHLTQPVVRAGGRQRRGVSKGVEDSPRLPSLQGAGRRRAGHGGP